MDEKFVPWVLKGDPRQKMAGFQEYAAKHPDGTLETWQMETIKVVRPSIHSYAYVRSSLLGKVIGVVSAKESPYKTKWTLSQFFYRPGDWTHVNGQFIELLLPDTLKKNLAKLKKLGFVKVDREQKSAMMPEMTSILPRLKELERRRSYNYADEEEVNKYRYPRSRL